jgi:hypothetical protein
MGAIEAGWTDNEIGHIKGQEALTIEAAWIALWQHESLSNGALGINMTEIRSRKEAIVTTGAQDKPA